MNHAAGHLFCSDCAAWEQEHLRRLMLSEHLRILKQELVRRLMLLEHLRIFKLRLKAKLQTRNATRELTLTRNLIMPLRAYECKTL